jgi:hypothetical protein
MTGQTSVSTLTSAWEEAASLTRDFVAPLSVQILNIRLPRPGLNTIAKHIWEMCAVRSSYAQGLRGQKVSFESAVPITIGQQDYEASSTEQLLVLLQSAEEDVCDAVRGVSDWYQLVDLMGTPISKEAMLEALVRHETLHQGQLIAYGYLLKTAFPQSWIDAWFLPA